MRSLTHYILLVLCIGRNEAEIIHKIAQEVSRIIKRAYLDTPKCLVGIESRVQDINLLLRIEVNELVVHKVRMIEIFGADGIGKTNVAKEIYNLIGHRFEACCFLANIREISNQEGGLIQLQETLLFDVLGGSKSLNVGNVDKGINVIKDRICSKRVLLVLDDVDQLVQLEKVDGDRDWFHLGSKIIITTRDQNLLINHEVNAMYQVQILDRNDSIKLFSWYAFKKDKPADSYKELTEHVIEYAGGLPLALTILGSHLKAKTMPQWKSALDRYKRIPNKNIQEILRISFDGLEDSEKEIFLDIACFFEGEHVDHVVKIMDSCGFSPDIGIRNLMDKCLINIDLLIEKLWVHDLLQQMAG